MSKRSAIRMFMEQNMIMIGIIDYRNFFVPIGITTKRAYQNRLAGILYNFSFQDITPYTCHPFINKIEDYIDML